MTITARTYFRPHRRQIAKLGAVALLAAQLEALSLVVIVPLAQAVSEGDDQASGSLGPVDLDVSVSVLLGIAFGMVALAALANALLTVIRARLIARFEQHERDEILELYTRSDWPTQQAVRGGRLLQLSGYTAKASMILLSITQGIRAGISVATFVLISFLLDWRAAAAIVVTGALLSVLLRPLAQRVRRATAAMSREHLEYAQEIHDLSESTQDLRVFGAAEIALDRLQTRSKRLARLKRRQHLLSGLMAPAYQYAGLSLILVAILFASRAQDLDVASLGAIALLLLRSLSYAQQIQNSYRGVIENVPFLERLEEAREEYRANQLPTGGTRLEAVHTLELCDVSYLYDEASPPALSGLNLTLRAGEIVGVVGPSGSGKSTLLQILLRLREPTTGVLRANGADAESYSLTSWYEQISMVPQSPHLLHATVSENIAMLRPDISPDHVERAARAAGVHDVIESLPDGYSTHVGPSFRDLSGGQIQRIGIARALARGASVLVLDEPTSALDHHSESQIQDTLTSLHGEVTLIVIAHRLSTLSICDRLVVLRDGCLEAAGPLADVFETNDFFRKALDTGELDLAAIDLDQA